MKMIAAMSVAKNTARTVVRMSDTGVGGATKRRVMNAYWSFCGWSFMIGWPF